MLFIESFKVYILRWAFASVSSFAAHRRCAIFNFQKNKSSIAVARTFSISWRNYKHQTLFTKTVLAKLRIVAFCDK